MARKRVRRLPPSHRPQRKTAHRPTLPSSRWLLGLALLLGGCGGLLESDGAARSTWWLEPPAASPGAKPAVARPVGLKVTVVPGLDTDRVLTLDSQARLNHFDGAHWPDFLPELLDSLVSRSLADAGWGIRPAHGLHDEDCLLRLEAQRFWTRLDGQDQASRAEVAFAGQLECDSQAAVPIEASVAMHVTAHRMPDVVSATQKALNGAMAEVLAQLAAATTPTSAAGG